MNNLGISSATNAYKASVNALYGTAQVSLIKNGQESSDAEISLPDNSPTGEIKDEAIISDEAKTLLAKDQNGTLPDKSSDNVKTEDQGTEKSKEKDTLPQPKRELTPEQEQEVAKLKARDVEVKAHEQAHIAAAAGISTSAPTYEYQTGPDGKEYAIGGEVSVSFVAGKDPAQNMAHAEAMKAAALAPAQPSSQDIAVAADAEKIIAEARQELAQQQTEANTASDKSDKTEKPEEVKEVKEAGPKVSSD